MREKSGTSAIENFDPENQGIKIIILNFAKIKQRLKLQDLGPLSAAPRILFFFLVICSSVSIISSRSPSSQISNSK